MPGVMSAASPALPRLQRLAAIASLPLAAGLGYLVSTQGTRAAGAVVVLVAGVILVVCALTRPSLAVLPLVALLPVTGYLIVLYPAAGFSLAVDMLAVFPFTVLVLRWLVHPERIPLFSGPQALVWALLGVAALQFVNPDGTPLGVTAYGARQLMLPMLLFFVGFHIERSVESLRRVAWILVVTGWIPIVCGLRQQFLGLTPAEAQYARRIAAGWVDREVRIFGTFESPWALAAYCGGVALIAVGFAVSTRDRWRRLVALSTCAFATATLAFTYVRAYFLGYVAGLVFLALIGIGLRFGIGRVFSRFFVLAAGYVAFTLVLGPVLVSSVAPDTVAAQRLVSILAPTRQFAFEARITNWANILTIGGEHPLGIGLGSTGGIAARFKSELRMEPIHPDNTYLRLYLETGWLGAALFVVLVVWTLVRAVRVASWPLQSEHAWIVRGAAAYLVMIAVASVATATGDYLYWLLSGLVARYGARVPSAGWAAARRRVSRVAGPVGLTHRGAAR